MDPILLATTAVSLLSPCLVKMGEKAAEEVGKRLPDVAGKLWNTTLTKLQGKPAAEEAIKDFVAKPEDKDNQAAFRKELRKVLEAEPAFQAEFERLLGNAEREAGDTLIVTGSGAAAMKDGVAAGEGGIAVRGDVLGGITYRPSEKRD
jgi:hypothetical protein